jgi:hypothetical protein
LADYEALEKSGATGGAVALVLWLASRLFGSKDKQLESHEESIKELFDCSQTKEAAKEDSDAQWKAINSRVVPLSTHNMCSSHTSEALAKFDERLLGIMNQTAEVNRNIGILLERSTTRRKEDPQ